MFDAESGELIQSLFADTPDADDGFGFSVGIEGNSLVVGAPGASEGEDDNGIVYLFEPSDFEPLNTISGTSDSDRLVGTADSEILSGLAGNDTIFGRAGDDVLDGGAGQDRLNGGKGADQFVLREGDGNDTIIGYQDGIDSFLLTDGLAFEDLTIVRDRGRTTVSIASTAENLVSLFGVNPDSLNTEDFAPSTVDSNSSVSSIA